MSTAKRRAYQEKADAELRAWNARIDELVARAAAQKAAGKIEYYERLEKLTAKRDSVGEKLAALKESGTEAWEEMRKGFEEAHRDLSTAFHAALDTYRDDDRTSSGLPKSTPAQGDGASPGA